MYLPKIYEKFSAKFPDVFKNFQELGKTCRESGPLEKKYQDLANLGIAIGASGTDVAREPSSLVLLDDDCHRGQFPRGGDVANPQGAGIRCQQRRNCPSCFIILDNHWLSEHDCGHGLGG